jgi:hypothetical protein
MAQADAKSLDKVAPTGMVKKLALFIGVLVGGCRIGRAFVEPVSAS